MCDLAVSLATGTRFLGEFDVPRRGKVALFSSSSPKLPRVVVPEFLRRQPAPPKPANLPLLDQSPMAFPSATGYPIPRYQGASQDIRGERSFLKAAST
jgi:hypothetical protein